jgi:hypothetical protein
VDVSSGFDIANPYGLRAADFDYDMDSYGSALTFLSDLAGGSSEAEALEANGGSPAAKRSWETSRAFRRVLAKCRQAGEAEREYLAREAAAKESEPEKPAGPSNFIALEDMPRGFRR